MTHDRLISADDHVQEPPDLWTSRLSRAKWGERIPHLERRDGSETWIVDGRPLNLGGVASAAALSGDRTQEPRSWSEVPAAAYLPAERLRAMDADGVDCSVLYPTVAGVSGETFGRIADADLELACVQAYNDWLIDEWCAASERFIPQCILPLAPEAAAAEVRRAVSRGHKGVIYPSVPMELRDVPHINEPEYDLLWATCQELRVPICFHSGAASAVQFAAWDGFSPTLADALRAITGPASTVPVLVNVLLSRILTRFPELKVVFAESGLAWAAYLLEYADHQYEGDKLRSEGYALKPSELFRRQCYLTSWYDSASLQTRDFIGIDNILWCTNFPRATSTWPDSWKAIRRWSDDVPAAERDQILWRNAAHLYRL